MVIEFHMVYQFHNLNQHNYSDNYMYELNSLMHHYTYHRFYKDLIYILLNFHSWLLKTRSGMYRYGLKNLQR